jgi:hypothetical protein
MQKIQKKIVKKQFFLYNKNTTKIFLSDIQIYNTTKIIDIEHKKFLCVIFKEKNLKKKFKNFTKKTLKKILALYLQTLVTLYCICTLVSFKI